MLRITIEQLDEFGRVAEVKHVYQDEQNVFEFLRYNLDYSVELDVEYDSQRIDGEKRMNVFIEQRDEKGHRVSAIQLY